METVYMAVTADELELPLCVEKYPDKLAEKYGITYNNLISMITKGLSGRNKKVKFIKVEVEDE